MRQTFNKKKTMKSETILVLQLDVVHSNDDHTRSSCHPAVATNKFLSSRSND